MRLPFCSLLLAFFAFISATSHAEIIGVKFIDTNDTPFGTAIAGLQATQSFFTSMAMSPMEPSVDTGSKNGQTLTSLAPSSPIKSASPAMTTLTALLSRLARTSAKRPLQPMSMSLQETSSFSTISPRGISASAPPVAATPRISAAAHSMPSKSFPLRHNTTLTQRPHIIYHGWLSSVRH